MQLPLATEYAPYYQKYIDLVPAGDFLDVLTENTEKTVHFFYGIPIEKEDYRYAEGKWSVKEVLMHIVDTERAMSYRAFVAARGDSNTILYPMDENVYAANVDVSTRSLESIVNEFAAVRSATQTIYDHLTDAQSLFPARGQAHPITARALGYIMIGHIEHHLNVLTERYTLDNP